jgi:hypothetical protein
MQLHWRVSQEGKWLKLSNILLKVLCFIFLWGSCVFVHVSMGTHMHVCAPACTGVDIHTHMWCVCTDTRVCVWTKTACHNLVVPWAAQYFLISESWVLGDVSHVLRGFHMLLAQREGQVPPTLTPLFSPSIHQELLSQIASSVAPLVLYQRILTYNSLHILEFL